MGAETAFETLSDTLDRKDVWGTEELHTRCYDQLKQPNGLRRNLQMQPW